MVLGLVMLTASWGTSLEGWVICYAWSLFVYSKLSPTFPRPPFPECVALNAACPFERR